MGLNKSDISIQKTVFILDIVFHLVFTQWVGSVIFFFFNQPNQDDNATKRQRATVSKRERKDFRRNWKPSPKLLPRKNGAT